MVAARGCFVVYHGMIEFDKLIASCECTLCVCLYVVMRGDTLSVFLHYSLPYNF